MSKGVFFRHLGTQQLVQETQQLPLSLDKNITVQESTYTIIRQQGFNSVLFPYQHQRTADIINISPRGIPSTHKTAFNSRRHIIEVQFSNSPSHWYIHQPSILTEFLPKYHQINRSNSCCNSFWIRPHQTSIGRTSIQRNRPLVQRQAECCPGL